MSSLGTRRATSTSTWCKCLGECTCDNSQSALASCMNYRVCGLVLGVFGPVLSSNLKSWQCKSRRCVPGASKCGVVVAQTSDRCIRRT